MRMRWFVLGGLVTGLVFGWSVLVRWAYVDDLTNTTHQWLTMSTKTFTDSWLAEGAMGHGFALLEHPPSIEFADLQARRPYVSYPPGAIVWPYVLARLRGEQRVSARTVHLCGMAAHGVVVGCVFAMVWLLGRATLPLRRALLAVGAGLFLSVTQPMLYFFGMVYFADTAVLPLTSLVVLIELLRVRDLGSGRSRSVLAVVQMVALGLAVLTDWFGVVVGLCVVLFRVLDARGRTPHVASHTHWAAVPALVMLAGLALFAMQVQSLDGGSLLRARLLERTYSAGVVAGDPLIVQLGVILVKRLTIPYALVLAGLAAYGFRTWRRHAAEVDVQRRVLAWVLLLLLLPVVLHMALLVNHTAAHRFSALKFLIMLAVLLFGVLPALVAGAQGSMRRWGRILFGGGVAAMVLTSALTMDLRREAWSLHGIVHEELALHLRATAGYGDVYCSSTVSIAAVPPHALALSGKVVHLLSRMDSLEVLHATALRSGGGVAPRMHWVRFVEDAVPAVVAGRLVAGGARRVGRYVVQPLRMDGHD